jgi:hypothetical protein
MPNLVHIDVESPETYYQAALDAMINSGVPFMVGGAYALRGYTGIVRETKDFDVFCRPGDYPHLLETLIRAGYEPKVTDPNWIVKAYQGDHYVDIIFDSANGSCRVDDSWLEHAPEVELLGRHVRLIPAEEMVWSKMYVADRHRFDGADVMHVMLKQGPALDWKRLLSRMDRDWELLYSYVMLFLFVYPAERDVIPNWLLEELVSRLTLQRELPAPQDRLCRGTLLSRTGYLVDIQEWGFKTQPLSVL